MSGRQSVQKGCRRVPLMHQELCRTENRRGSLVGAPSLVRTHALKFLWPFQCVRKQRCVPQFFPPQFFPSAERPALVRLRAGSTRSDGRLKVWSAVRARAGSGSERASEARSNEIEGLPPRLVPRVEAAHRRQPAIDTLRRISHAPFGPPNFISAAAEGCV